MIWLKLVCRLCFCFTLFEFLYFGASEYFLLGFVALGNACGGVLYVMTRHHPTFSFGEISVSRLGLCDFVSLLALSWKGTVSAVRTPFGAT